MDLNIYQGIERRQKRKILSDLPVQGIEIFF